MRNERDKKSIGSTTFIWVDRIIEIQYTDWNLFCCFPSWDFDLSFILSSTFLPIYYEKLIITHHVTGNVYGDLQVFAFSLRQKLKASHVLTNTFVVNISTENQLHFAALRRFARWFVTKLNLQIFSTWFTAFMAKHVLNYSVSWTQTLKCSRVKLAKIRYWHSMRWYLSKTILRCEPLINCQKSKLNVPSVAFKISVKHIFFCQQ